MTTPTPRLLSEAAQSLIDKAAADRRAAQTEISDMLQSQSTPASATPASASPASGVVRPPRYTAQALIDLMVEHPNYTHKQFAAHFGYTASWFAATLSSDRFQREFDPRRHEVSNPMLTGTLEDMYRALTVQSLSVMQEKLNSPAASEALILKSAEIGIKALAMKKQDEDPAANDTGNVSKLASRLLALMPQGAQPQVPARDFTIDATLNELPE